MPDPPTLWTPPSGRWAGKRAVITGGASGIGHALAHALVARGARVAILDRDIEVERVARALGATGICCDVRSAGALQDAANAIDRRFGGLDLLVNNAGVSVAGDFADLPADDFAFAIDVNLHGVVNGCRAFLPLLGRGSAIVNTCSSFAWLGFPGKSAYAASKAAVRAFSESLRLELAPRGIGVTLLFPGPVQTALIRAGRAVDPAQRESEDRFLARRGVPAALVAERCLAGVERNRPRVVVSLDYVALDLLARLSPDLASWVVGRLASKLPF